MDNYTFKLMGDYTFNLNAEGVNPVWFLKYRVKYDWFGKLRSLDISWMDLSLFWSKNLISTIVRSVIQSIGNLPDRFFITVEKYLGVKHASFA